MSNTTNTITQEIWKTIPGSDNWMISNYGNMKDSNGKPYPGWINNHSYRCASVKAATGSNFYTTFHRAVGAAFGILDSLKDPREIDHINANRLDNRLENLQAITHKDNIEKRDKSGNGRCRAICVFDAITNDYIGTYKSSKECAQDLGLYTSDISFVLNHRTAHYQHGGYTFKFAEPKKEEYSNAESQESAA